MSACVLVCVSMCAIDYSNRSSVQRSKGQGISSMACGEQKKARVLGSRKAVAGASEKKRKEDG